MAGTGSYWPVMYFILWYIFSMMLLTNCITSFSIDCFTLLNKARKRTKKAQWQRILHNAPGFSSEFDVRQSKLGVNTVYFDKFLDEIQSELENVAKTDRQRNQLQDAESELSKSGDHTLWIDMLNQMEILGNLRRRMSTEANINVSMIQEDDIEEEEKENDNDNDLRRVMRAAFEKLDRNGDGKVSPFDLSETLRLHCGMENGDLVTKMISQLDTDGDGYVDRDEFYRMFSSV